MANDPPVEEQSPVVNPSHPSFSASASVNNSGNGQTPPSIDLASVMALLDRQNQAHEERYRRLEQRLEEQGRFAREFVGDPRTSMNEVLRVPESALRDEPRVRPTARRVDFTPLAVDRTSEDEDEEKVSRATSRRKVVTDEEALEKVLKLIRGFVPTFYANVNKDKGTTVVDFVEKAESVMADVLRDHPQVKLSVIRMCLQDGALRWLNRRLEKLKAEGVEEPRWDRDVRAAFLNEHNGNNTPELWLAKLHGLRLGKGSTPTPIELDNQFDTIARHLVADLSDERTNNLFLSTEYGSIIRNSDFTMYTTILRSCPHATLRQWKVAVAQQWNAEAVIKSATSNKQSHRGGRWEWQGRGGHQSSSGTREPALNAIEAQGEGYTVEGEPDVELNAAVSEGGQRGGRRGGRGGGRGGERGGERGPSFKRDLQKINCFRCGQAGHVARTCPAPTPSSANQSSTNQSNE